MNAAAAERRTDNNAPAVGGGGAGGTVVMSDSSAKSPRVEFYSSAFMVLSSRSHRIRSEPILRPGLTCVDTNR